LENYDLIVDRYTSPNATGFQYREGSKEYEIPGMAVSLPLQDPEIYKGGKQQEVESPAAGKEC